MKKIIFASTLLSIFTLASCGSEHEEKEEEESYVVSSPVVMDTTIIKDYVCQIHSIQHIELRALERGYLQAVFVDEGQAVKKGQRLFQIMPSIYEAEMQSKQAEADLAEIEYQTTSQLADKNVVSKNEQAMAKAKLAKAKAELKLAQVHLGFTEIKAPFDGIVGKFQDVRLGSLLDEGDLLTTLSDNGKMWVYFNVPEAEYLNYQSVLRKDKMLEVNLLMANNQMFDYIGVVETIESDFNNETGNIAFRATFPNPERLLRHGETGNIQVESTLKNALLIPQKATFEVLEKRYVYVIDKNNVAHAREIEIASEIPDLYVIRKGVKPTDRIMIEGIRKVSDNEKIHYEYVKPEKIFSELNVYVE